MPSCSTGELAKPHCAFFTMKKPESSTPKLRCQSGSPSWSNAYRPSLPKNATTRSPSTAGVDAAWLPFGCRWIAGTPSHTARRQSSLPAAMPAGWLADRWSSTGMMSP